MRKEYPHNNNAPYGAQQTRMGEGVNAMGIFTKKQSRSDLLKARFVNGAASGAGEAAGNVAASVAIALVTAVMGSVAAFGSTRVASFKAARAANKEEQQTQQSAEAAPNPGAA